MRLVATPLTATITGVYCAIVLLLLAPQIDSPSSSSLWLVLGALAVGIPAFFFVLGVKREEMVGLWLMQRSLLDRIASFLLAAAASVALGNMASMLVRS